MQNLAVSGFSTLHIEHCIRVPPRVVGEIDSHRWHAPETLDTCLIIGPIAIDKQSSHDGPRIRQKIP